MVVELFYLLAFIVGLGAFFVFFVLGTKKKEEAVIGNPNNSETANIDNTK